MGHGTGLAFSSSAALARASHDSCSRKAGSSTSGKPVGERKPQESSRRSRRKAVANDSDRVRPRRCYKSIFPEFINASYALILDGKVPVLWALQKPWVDVLFAPRVIGSPQNCRSDRKGSHLATPVAELLQKGLERLEAKPAKRVTAPVLSFEDAQWPPVLPCERE